MRSFLLNKALETRGLLRTSGVFLISWRSSKDKYCPYLKVLKQVDLETYMTKLPAQKAKTPLTVPVSEFEIGSSMNISLEHKHGGSAYSSVTSYLVLKGVVTTPIKTVEELHAGVTYLGAVADKLIKERVIDTARTVHLKPVFETKSDDKLELNDMLSSIDNMEQSNG